MIQVKGTHRKEGSSRLMSAEELKARLQQHFAQSGTLNNLKSQLRNQLVTELFRVADLPTDRIENELPDAEARKTLLPLQVSNWLVYDHLKREGYDYSLSTFVTEASISFPEKLLSLRDILDLLGFKSESEESKTITEHYVHRRQGSFLHSLLLCVMKQHKEHSRMDFDCKETKDKEHSVTRNDGNILMHQQLHLNGSWTEQKSEQPTSKESGSDSKLHQQKLRQMMQSEKEGQESEVQRLRQKLLNELDRLYEHEQQVRLELEQRRSRMTRDQELLDIERNKLRAKELELAKHSSQVQAENKMFLLKEEGLSVSLKKKEEEFSELEDRLKQQEHRFNEERQASSSQKREIEDLRNQLQQSERNCQRIQNEYSTLLAENAVLKGKVESATDYECIKTELLSNLKEVESCRMEIKEIKERSEEEKRVLLSTVKNLEEQLNMYLQKGNNVQDVGVSTEMSYFQDKSMWNQQKDRLEQELSETKQLYCEVLKKLQEQNEDIQDLHLSIHVLHDEISDASNEGKRAPKAKNQNSTVPPPTIPGADIRPAQSQSTFSPRTQQSYNAQYPGLFYPSPGAQRSPKEDPYKFIYEARKRITDLEQEAQAVKKKYSIFIASQMKLPPPSYIAYGNAFHSYDSVNPDYQFHKGGMSSLHQTTVTNKHDNNHTVPFIGDPCFATSHHNCNEKTLTNHGLTDLQDEELVRNLALPHNRHVHFQDEHFVSHKIDSSGVILSDLSSNSVVPHYSPLHRLDAYPRNKENQSQVQITSSHKHPISSESASTSVSRNLQFSTQLHDNGEQPMSVASTASALHSSSMLKHASIDHPFHLSKFGLYSSANKTVTSPSAIAHSQVEPHVTDSESQLGNYTEKSDSCGESLSRDHPEISDASALNNKSNHLNLISSVDKQSLLESKRKSELSDKVDEECPHSSPVNYSSNSKHLVSVSNHDKGCKEQLEERQVSNHSPGQTENLQNVSNSENGNVNESFNEVTSCQTLSLKPNKSTVHSADVEKLSDEAPSSEVKQDFGKVEDDGTPAEVSGTKTKDNETLRRLSVDLDSAWKKQVGSVPSVVKNFVKPRSGSSYSLPSRFDLVGTAAEVKPGEQRSLKCDDFSGKEVSSPRSHSFSETHLINDIAKVKYSSTVDGSGTVAETDGMQINQPSEDPRNSHEYISGNSNNMTAGNVKDLESSEKHTSAVNVSSMGQTKQTSSSEVIGQEEELPAGGGDSQDEVRHEGYIIKQSGDESDAKSLPHMSQSDDEIVASSERDVSISSELNVDVAPRDLLHVNTKLDTEIGTVSSSSEVDNHQDNDKRCEKEAASTKDPTDEERSDLEGSGANHDGEGGHDESASELSELNLSAGNEELEESKSEESGW